MLQKIGIMLMGLLLLSGCGFHLRGSSMVLSQLHTLYLESATPYDPMVSALRRGLSSWGITLVKTPQQSVYTLQVLSISLVKALNNISSSTLTRAFTLIETCTFQIKDRNDKVIYGPQTIIVTNSYTTSDNQLLGDTAVLQMLKQQMQRELLFQMIMRLNSSDARKAFQQPPP